MRVLNSLQWDGVAWAGAIRGLLASGIVTDNRTGEDNGVDKVMDWLWDWVIFLCLGQGDENVRLGLDFSLFFNQL